MGSPRSQPLLPPHAPKSFAQLPGQVPDTGAWAHASVSSQGLPGQWLSQPRRAHFQLPHPPAHRHCKNQPDWNHLYPSLQPWPGEPSHRCPSRGECWRLHAGTSCKTTNRSASPTATGSEAPAPAIQPLPAGLARCATTPGKWLFRYPRSHTHLLVLFQIINSSGQKPYSGFHPGTITGSQIIRSAAGTRQAKLSGVQASKTCVPGTRRRAGPVPARLTKEPLPHNDGEPTLARAAGETASRHSANRAKTLQQSKLLSAPSKRDAVLQVKLCLCILEFQKDITAELGNHPGRCHKTPAVASERGMRKSAMVGSHPPDLRPKISFPSPASRMLQSKEPDPLLTCITSSLSLQKSRAKHTLIAQGLIPGKAHAVLWAGGNYR